VLFSICHGTNNKVQIESWKFGSWASGKELKTLTLLAQCQLTERKVI